MKIEGTNRRFKAAPVSILVSTIIVIFVFVAGYAHGQEMPFPTYGSGAVRVCIYTDYFCPPCRGMEPAVEPVLRGLLKKNIITLTLVDVPFSSHSALFARYFLYALKVKNDFEHALMVRNTLFEATGNRDITTAEKIEELFKSKGIPYSAFEPRSAFDRYNALIKADKINATPSCVIIKGGKKETFIGGADIIRALNALK